MLSITEPHIDLSTAYGKLFDVLTVIREKQSYQFAQLLKDWTAIGSTRKSVLPIEQIVETVVAPLAATQPVLLIVIDGMSFAVVYELLSDLTQKHWQLITPDAQTSTIRAGLAAIPSETKVSRTSLICGALTQGQQHHEKKGFSQHPGLFQHCKRSAPPLLFHKDALHSITPPILSEELYNAINSEKHQVVGLVINAVDDLLSKGDQVDIDWTCDRINILEPILQAANNAERLVILTSDHGHVLHHGTQYQSANGGERWRVDEGNPRQGELQIEGDRVISANSKSVIAPWTEKLRYSGHKKTAIMGGINPQEIIVPIAILTSSLKCPEGWQEKSLSYPDWWDMQKFEDTEAISTTVIPVTPNNVELSSLPLFSYTTDLSEKVE